VDFPLPGGAGMRLTVSRYYTPSGHAIQADGVHPDVAVELEGKSVVILDDVISTGGTIVEAAKLLKKKGSLTVSAACTHGLFLKDAFERIKAVVGDVYSTDTLGNPAEKASVAPDIAQILQRLVAG
jgi:ribose-phosphate pyrophosphokinase